MAEFNEYTSVVFWDFKRRDNAEYNFTVVEALISAASNSHKSCKFYYKPIFITIVSIIECTIYDLLRRIQEHRYEIIDLDSNDVEIIKNLELPARLKNYNDICRKYKLLGETSDRNIYQYIENLIETRNRIHIQNDKGNHPLDELNLWTAEKVKSAGSILKQLFLFISSKYQRPEHIHDNPNLDSFPTPWEKLL